MDDWMRDDPQSTGEEGTSPMENNDISNMDFISTGAEAGSASFGSEPAPVWTGAVLPDLEILGIQPGLVLSEKQRQHVSILKKMLETEDAPAPKTRQRRDPMADFWPGLIRFGTAALLIIVVVLNVTRNTPGLPVPEIPAETRRALVWIDRLGRQDAVLVAFDYQPGFGFEVEHAAAPILERIEARGAHVNTISTLPLGPLLAEQFYASRVQSPVTHLGYLPGGSLGLAQVNLAITEAEKGKSQTQIGESPTTPSGQAFPKFTRLDSLHMVVVITENAQKGRDWIEQIRPQGREMPIIIVTSAQAAPIMRAYLTTVRHPEGMTQVVGMISGLDAGLAVSGQPAAVVEDGWNAYEMGVVVGALTILVALVAGWLNRQRLQRTQPSSARSSRI